MHIFTATAKFPLHCQSEPLPSDVFSIFERAAYSSTRSALCRRLKSQRRTPRPAGFDRAKKLSDLQRIGRDEYNDEDEHEDNHGADYGDVEMDSISSEQDRKGEEGPLLSSAKYA